MTLYIAVTGDEYELPLYVTESVDAMASWAGIKVSSVRSMVCRNQGVPPLSPNGRKIKYRLRKIVIEEEEK